MHAPQAAVGVKELVRAAKGRCELVFLLRPDVARAHPAMLDLARALAETIVLRGDDISGIDNGLGLAGLTTFHDAELEFTDAMLRRLGMPGAPQVDLPWDKLVQRQRFAAAGVSRVRAVPVDSPHHLAAAAGEVGLPAVLKPRRSAGSVGLSFVDSYADLAREVRTRKQWAGLLLEGMIPRAEHPSYNPWLADYVSVETLTGPDGRHRHVAIFDKLPLSMAAEASPFAVRETGDVLPSRLPAAVRVAALTTVSAALDALGVRSRVSHTELRVSPSSVDVIEVNGRLGGEVEQMLDLLGGAGMVAAALELALGHPAPTPPEPEPGLVACVYVPFARRDGHVQSDADPAPLRAIPGVVRVDQLARQGDPRSATAFHAAKFTLRAATASGLDAALAEALDLVAELFAADGLDGDPWLKTMRAGLDAAALRDRRVIT